MNSHNLKHRPLRLRRIGRTRELWRTIKGISLGTFLVWTLTSCSQPEANSGGGLRLPEGNIIAGQEAFVSLSCHRCHSVDGVDFPEEDIPATGINITLGGEEAVVKTYGRLLTSITNPEHVVRDKHKALIEASGASDITSMMPVMNEHMTVQQLIDIIAFLDDHYSVVVPDYINTYPY